VIEPSVADRQRVPTTSHEEPSYAYGTSGIPLLRETIGENFDRMVGAQPDHEALVEVQTGRRWTYHQLAEEVDTLALGLLATGIVKGDRGDWQPDSPHPRNGCVFAVSR